MRPAQNFARRQRVCGVKEKTVLATFPCCGGEKPRFSISCAAHLTRREENVKIEQEEQKDRRSARAGR